LALIRGAFVVYFANLRSGTESRHGADNFCPLTE
jgi:hypothetical protein